MSQSLLIDIEPVLLERIKRLAESRGWDVQAALMHLLEYGLFACERTPAKRWFDDSDANALQSAIDALEGIPDDPGFALIGRADGPDDQAG